MDLFAGQRKKNLDAVAHTLEDELMRQRFGGGTLIQAAVDDAAVRLRGEKRTERRRAVLIVTDNMGTRTRREETVVRDFWEADAILSGLIISNPKFQTMNTVATIMGPQRLLMQEHSTQALQHVDLARTRRAIGAL